MPKRLKTSQVVQYRVLADVFNIKNAISNCIKSYPNNYAPTDQRKKYTAHYYQNMSMGKLRKFATNERSFEGLIVRSYVIAGRNRVGKHKSIVIS